MKFLKSISNQELPKLSAVNWVALKGPLKISLLNPSIVIYLSENGTFHYNIPTDYTAFANIIEGVGNFNPRLKTSINSGHLIKWGPGERIEIRTGNTGVRFLFYHGKSHQKTIYMGRPNCNEYPGRITKSL